MSHTVTVTGDQGLTPVRYNSVDAGTTFDLTTATFHIDNYQLDGDYNAYPFQVRTPTGAVTINGGTFVSEEHDDLTWDHIYHAQPGNSAGIFVESSFSYTVKNASITGAWDAIRTGGSGTFLIDDVYVHGNRDDAIENDNGNAGVVRDSLFEDSFSGFSLSDGDIQQLNNNTFELDGVLMKLEDYPYEGSVVTHGPLFKLEHNRNTGGIETNPFIKINNSVLAIEKVDHEGLERQAHAWSRLTSDSANNVFLNLSDTPLPSSYPKPPANWTILQGQAARDYWEAARADWIDRHDGTDPPPPVVPTVSVADKTLAEDGGSMGFVVTLSQATTVPVTVNYATSNGTATAGSDYTNTSGTLTFAAGETTKTVNVLITNDTVLENSETLTFMLSSPSGATIADGTATGTITDNDTPPPSGPTLSVQDATVTEGNNAVTIILSSGPVPEDTWINYHTVHGTAGSGDYTVVSSGQALINGPDDRVTISIPTVADGVAEGPETFSIVIDSATLANSGQPVTITDGTAVVTINDASAPPTDPPPTFEGTNYTGTAAAELIVGNSLNNVIDGADGNDDIHGGAGNDIIRGSLGADELCGDAGSDTFDFNKVVDSNRANGFDTICDFQDGIDLIDVLNIDANKDLVGNQAFTFVSGPLTAAGQLNAVYDATANQTVVSGNVDADTKAEFKIYLDGNFALTAADFVL